MILDRKLQLAILVALESRYPDSLLITALPFFSEGREFMANLFYLREHGFIQGGDFREPGQCRSMVDAQITKEGLDFLQDDGGIDSLLALRQLSLDLEEIQQAMERAINRLVTDDTQRQALLEHSSTLGANELRSVLLGLVEEGLSRADIFNFFFPEKPDGGETIRSTEG